MADRPDFTAPHGFTKFIRDRYPDTSQQQALGKKMRGFLDSPEWRLIEEVLEAQVAVQLAAMRPPRVREHVEYAAGHAMVEGLRSARMAADAVVQVAESADIRAASSQRGGRGG